MNVNCRFDNEYYGNLDGIAMGLPLGSLLADILLAGVENGPLEDIVNHLTPYCRYIDDTFIVLEKSL